MLLLRVRKCTDARGECKTSSMFVFNVCVCVCLFQIDNSHMCLDLLSAPVIVSQLTSEGKWKSKDKSR